MTHPQVQDLLDTIQTIDADRLRLLGIKAEAAMGPSDNMFNQEFLDRPDPSEQHSGAASEAMERRESDKDYLKREYKALTAQMRSVRNSFNELPEQVRIEYSRAFHEKYGRVNILLTTDSMNPDPGQKTTGPI